jgi:hypothetical protein
MAGDMGSPDIGAVDAVAERDEVGEGGQESCRVGDPQHVVQVPIRIKEYVDPALTQPVHEG